MTREDFINWLEERYALNENDIYEFGQLYDEATKPRWISVEDELPKKGQSCIILIDRKVLQGTPRIRSAVYVPNVMMQQEGFVYNRMSKKHHITHWMPLPQAPKEGGEK